MRMHGNMMYDRRKTLLLFLVTLFLLCFFLLSSESHAETLPEEAKAILSKLGSLPSVIWDEGMATAEVLANLGPIRRYENIYYHEYSEFASDGLGRWGAPFTKLLMDPNASKRRKWDYRVEARKNDFKAIARRREGKYAGREIWFDRRGHWSGNYPFWPLRMPRSFF